MSNQRIVLDQDVVVTHLQKAKCIWSPPTGARDSLPKAMYCPRMRYCLPRGQPGRRDHVHPGFRHAEQGDAVLANAGHPMTSPPCCKRFWTEPTPPKAFEASAAGGAPAAGNAGAWLGASGNGGFVTIDRTGDATISSAGFDGANPANGAAGGCAKQRR